MCSLKIALPTRLLAITLLHHFLRETANYIKSRNGNAIFIEENITICMICIFLDLLLIQNKPLFTKTIAL